MLNFLNTTLIFCDGTGNEFHDNENIISKMLQICKFKDIVHFTANTNQVSNLSTVVYTKKFSYYEYQQFCIYGVNSHVHTDFAFYMQNDGFIVNPNMFDPAFFEYDYIGAPWQKGIFCIKKYNYEIVGNGGFSIRSKRLLNYCQNIPHVTLNEDTTISVRHRPSFEKLGCRFAPVELAKKFSIEMPLEDSHTIENTFGFHGRWNKEKALQLLEKNTCQYN
jgi:hypothetical protein